jgi:trk system potassium uptake protein TrkH
MLVPSAHALVVENYAEARSFFYTGMLGLFFLFMIAIAASNRKIMESGVQQLASLAFGLLLLPLFLAIPEYDIIQNTYFHKYLF